jgi:hypothetical protein
MQDELRHEEKLESARMARGVEFDGPGGGETEARSEHQALTKPKSGRRDTETVEAETQQARTARSEAEGGKRSKRKERDEGSTRRSKSRSRHKTKKEPDTESNNNSDRRSQDQKEKRRGTTRTHESQAPPSTIRDSIFSKERPSAVDSDKAKLLMAKYLRKQLKKSGARRLKNV